MRILPGSTKATIAMDTLRVLDGAVPTRALGLVLEWASLHRDELLQNWELARAKAPLVPIPPLE
jgi:hypothetical protein